MERDLAWIDKKVYLAKRKSQNDFYISNPFSLTLRVNVALYVHDMFYYYDRIRGEGEVLARYMVDEIKKFINNHHFIKEITEDNIYFEYESSDIGSVRYSKLLSSLILRVYKDQERNVLGEFYLIKHDDGFNDGDIQMLIEDIKQAKMML